MLFESTYQSKEEVQVGVAFRREHDNIDNLWQEISRLNKRWNAIRTQNTAPTADVSIAVRIKLVMIESVSGFINQS